MATMAATMISIGQVGVGAQKYRRHGMLCASSGTTSRHGVELLSSHVGRQQIGAECRQGFMQHGPMTAS